MGYQKQGIIRSPVAIGCWVTYCIYPGAVWETQVCAHNDKTCTTRWNTTFIHFWCNSSRTAVSVTCSASFTEVSRKRNTNLCKHTLGVDRLSSVRAHHFTHIQEVDGTLQFKAFMVISAATAPGQPYAPVKLPTWKFECMKMYIGNPDPKAEVTPMSALFGNRLWKFSANIFFTHLFLFFVFLKKYFVTVRFFMYVRTGLTLPTSV